MKILLAIILYNFTLCIYTSWRTGKKLCKVKHSLRKHFFLWTSNQCQMYCIQFRVQFIYLFDFYCQFFPYFQCLLMTGFRQTFTGLHHKWHFMQQLKRKILSCTTVLPLWESQGVCINSEISSTSSPMISTGSFIPSNLNSWEFWTVNLSYLKIHLCQKTFIVYSSLNLLSCK